MFKTIFQVGVVIGIGLFMVDADPPWKFLPGPTYAEVVNSCQQGDRPENIASCSTLCSQQINPLFSGNNQPEIKFLEVKKVGESLTKQNTSKQNQLGTILAPPTKVEKVQDGFKFIEGPVWHPDGFLLFSDVPSNTIYQWRPGQPAKIFRHPSGKANGNALDRQELLITAEHDNRRLSRTERNGQIVALASEYQGKSLNSPNDIAVKSDNSIYFTDPPYGIKPEAEELGFYGVYRLASDGKLTLLVDDFIRPNGIVFSPDETKLYVNDSKKAHIRVFKVLPNGTLDEGKVFAELKRPGEPGAADGMEVDSQGNVYSTASGGIWVFSSAGELLGIIETPEPPANIAWGDDDYQTLYVTARTSLYRIRLQIPCLP